MLKSYTSESTIIVLWNILRAFTSRPSLSPAAIYIPWPSFIIYCHSLPSPILAHAPYPGSRTTGSRLVMDTIIIEHKMGGVLDYDLIEENLWSKWSIKWVDPDRVIDHGHCSSMVEYNRCSSTMLEYDPFCVYQEWNIHSVGIMSIHTRVITRRKNHYPIVHQVYHGNVWLIQSSLYSLVVWLS